MEARGEARGRARREWRRDILVESSRGRWESVKWRIEEKDQLKLELVIFTA
jgi:hypothetical protein